MSVENLGLPLRPKSVSLANAIENSIEDIAMGSLTPYEVLGVLDCCSKKFYEKYLSIHSIESN